MNENESVDIQLDSATWYVNETTKLLSEYKACRTEHAKNSMIPRLKELYGKLHFEAGQIERLIDEEDI